jgi:MOSC domain-containing protein YiiM
MTTGRTESLHITPSHREPVESLEESRFVAGYGIEGDRHASDQPGRKDCQVLMIDVETLTELGLKPGDVREQVTTSGFDVGSLEPGQEVALGFEVIVRVSRPATPCARMDEMRAGLQRRLQGRRGQLASIVTGGTVRVGDEVRMA